MDILAQLVFPLLIELVAKAIPTEPQRACTASYHIEIIPAPKISLGRLFYDHIIAFLKYLANTPHCRCCHLQCCAHLSQAHEDDGGMTLAAQ